MTGVSKAYQNAENGGTTVFEDVRSGVISVETGERISHARMIEDV